MDEKSEIGIVKTIALLLVIVTLIAIVGARQAYGQDKTQLIVELFSHYNKSLSQQQAGELANLVLQAGAQFKVDPFIIASIIVRESGARPWVISKGGDYGLMQVRWRVRQNWIRQKYPQVKDTSDLLKPEVNIFIGAEIFAGYYAKRGTIRSGLLCYSAGNKTLADRVLATVRELESLYQKSGRRIINAR